MKEVWVLTSIAAYGLAVVLWLMSWKWQQDRNYKGLRKLAEDTHTLVNSNMGVQLKLGMDLSEFKASTTGRPEDIQAAKLARHKYEEHVKKQAIVDSGAQFI